MADLTISSEVPTGAPLVDGTTSESLANATEEGAQYNAASLEAPPQVIKERTAADDAADALKVEHDAKIEAVHHEHSVIKAIEQAIISRQTADAGREALEKARAEAAAAANKHKMAQDGYESAKTYAADKQAECEAAKAALIKAHKDREEAEAAAESAATGMETAAAAAAAAEAELKTAHATKSNAEKDARAAGDKARAEATEVKWAKREADKTSMAAQDAANAEALAGATILECETSLVQKQDAATALAKVAYDLRDEQEEAERAVERATRAVAEFDGEGGAWAIRTQEQLKDRENELRKIGAQSAKASKAEADADAAVDTAQKRLDDARDDHVQKAAATVKATETAAEAAQTLVDQTAAADVATEEQDKAEKTALAADAEYEVVKQKLENAQSAASATFVERTAANAATARDKEQAAMKAETRSIERAAESKEAESKALVEMEAAAHVAEQKHMQAEKVADKDHEAEARAKVADGLIEELERKVLRLAVAKYAVRGAYMSVEEAEERAVETKAERREAGLKDLKLLAIGKQTATDYTAADKWFFFKHALTDSNRSEINQWNVRRLFHGIDGKMKSNLDTHLADYVGSALDRRKGPAMAKFCKLAGEGLEKASLGQVCCTHSLEGTARRASPRCAHYMRGHFVSSHFAPPARGWQVATFNIEACSPQGIRFDDGGDNFFVHIRFAGLATRIRARVIDNNDGSYVVHYKPTSAGRCTIQVSLLGEPLPGSPFSVFVSAPIPNASQCVVYGDALSSVTAGSTESFYIQFRDAVGQMAHASELDVWVHPLGDEDDLPSVAKLAPHLSEEVANLLKPIGPFESFIVGSTPLDVSSTREIESDWIGRMQPGRVLKILKIEPPRKDGLVRACILLEIEDREPNLSATWRDLWPQQQPWRTVSWRAHIEEEKAVAAQEEDRRMAMALAMQEEATRRTQAAAAQSIERMVRGKSARKTFARMRAQLEEPELTAEAEAAAAAIAAEEEARLAAQRAADARRRGGKDKGGGKEKGSKDKLGRKGTPPMTPTAADLAKAAADQGKPTAASDVGKTGDTTKASQPKGTDAKLAAVGKPGDDAATKAAEEAAKGKASLAKGKPAGKGKGKKDEAKARAADEAAKAALEAKVAEEATAATKVEAVIRGKLARKQFVEMREEAEAAALAALATEKAKKRGDKKGKGRKPKSLGTKLASKREEGDGFKAGKVKKSGDRGLETPSRGPVKSSFGSSTSLTKRETSPKGLKLSQLKQPELMHGWITLGMDGEVYVTRQTGRLPAHIRRQHLLQWERRAAKDSERERERAEIRDREIEEEKLREYKETGGTPRSGNRSARLSVLPVTKRPSLPIYVQEVENDPDRIGFAYGGVYPGRLHAKGKLFETHDVKFSIGVAGTYLLHVALRQPHDQPSVAPPDVVPNSPFIMTVLPGKAHPLSTQLHASEVPLQGGPDSKGDLKRFSCEIVLHTRDKFGNLCDKGEANITCGFLDMTGAGTARQPDDASALEGSKAVQPSNSAQEATCQDNADGSYRIRWVTDMPGIFNVFVKLDGLHLLSSPAVLHMSPTAAGKAAELEGKTPTGVKSSRKISREPGNT